MCGIVGISGGRLDRLAAANALLAHRGPDDFGVFADQEAGVGLGHRRLSIVDVSPLGHQPMTGADGAVVLVFNGEIYNFRELRAELEARGHSFRGHSDTEVLLNLYLAEGDAMLARLNGIFAFALWDKRKQLMLIARDAMGVKPLYYAALDGCFGFASEIKALLHLVPQAREVDMAALHRYLSFLWCPGEGTPLKAVRKLGPGEAMWIRSGRIERRWVWYQLPAFRGVTADLDERAAIQGTAMHLRQAVRRQMVADVPVGAFLSGGLDSSSVVAFARELNPDIRCFSIETVGDLEEGATDDLPYARRVAQHLGVSLDVVQIDVNRMAGDLEGMVAQLDEPLADPAPLNVLYISQLARKNGMKVLLSGTGGDDLFTGYRRHLALQAEHYWTWLPLRLRSGMRRMTLGLDQHRAYARRLTKLFDGAAMEGDARTVNYFRWSREVELLGLYTPEFRHAVTGELASAPMLDFLQPLPASVVPVERMLTLEQRFFLADHNLIYTDKMSMASGVEVRVPFLDLDLVEFAARIPTSMKQRGREGKWVLKKAMERYLPHDVIYRPKTGFGAPLRHWMRHNLHELVGDLMSAESLKRRGFFEPAAVQKLIAANYAGKVDASYTLLSLMSIEIWCRTYLDKPVCGADCQREGRNNVAIQRGSNELDASQLLVKRRENETSSTSLGVAFHDGIAEVWADGYLGGSFKRRHKVTLELLDRKVVSGENWLDLGCGAGVFSQELLNRGATVVAVDGSATMLKQARSIFGSSKLKLIQSDVQSIPQLSDRTFDGVLCLSVVEYLDRPEAALAEAARLLRPNGKLIVSLPPTKSVVRWGQRLIRLISKHFGRDLFPYLAVSRFELEPNHLSKWLSDAGFVLDQVTGFDPLFSTKILSHFRPSLLVIEAHKKQDNSETNFAIS